MLCGCTAHVFFWLSKFGSSLRFATVQLMPFTPTLLPEGSLIKLGILEEVTLSVKFLKNQASIEANLKAKSLDTCTANTLLNSTILNHGMNNVGSRGLDYNITTLIQNRTDTTRFCNSSSAASGTNASHNEIVNQRKKKMFHRSITLDGDDLRLFYNSAGGMFNGHIVDNTELDSDSGDSSSATTYETSSSVGSLTIDSSVGNTLNINRHVNSFSNRISNGGCLSRTPSDISSGSSDAEECGMVALDTIEAGQEAHQSYVPPSLSLSSPTLTLIPTHSALPCIMSYEMDMNIRTSSNRNNSGSYSSSSNNIANSSTSRNNLKRVRFS